MKLHVIRDGRVVTLAIHRPCFSYKALVRANIGTTLLSNDPFDLPSPLTAFVEWAQDELRQLPVVEKQQFKNAVGIVVEEEHPEWYAEVKNVGLIT